MKSTLIVKSESDGKPLKAREVLCETCFAFCYVHPDAEKHIDLKSPPEYLCLECYKKRHSKWDMGIGGTSAGENR